jgi:hypothetical protein
MVCVCVDWIHLAHDKSSVVDAVNTVMEHRISHKACNFFTVLVIINFPIMTLLHGLNCIIYSPIFNYASMTVT